MRTTVTIDDMVAGDLMRLTRAKTKTAAVNAALEEWVRWKKRQKIKELRGRLEVDGHIHDLRNLELAEIEELDG
jgi:Arc/MetJ family transcription regulator